MNPEKAGTLGWAGIGVAVVAFDLLSPESLSHAFQRGLENERTRPLVLGALAVTAAHLLNTIPRQYDPFYIAIDRRRHE